DGRVAARSLREADDLAVGVDVDPFGRGVPAQARHRAHVAADGVHVAGAGRRAYLAYREPPACGCAEQLRVRRDRQVRLGDDHGEAAVAELLVAPQLAGRVGCDVDAV